MLRATPESKYPKPRPEPTDEERKRKIDEVLMAIPDLLIEGIGKLEPLPMTAQRLIPILQNEETPFAEIVSIIEFDEAVVSNILRMANSSYYGGHCRIESLQ